MPRVRPGAVGARPAADGAVSRLRGAVRAAVAGRERRCRAQRRRRDARARGGCQGLQHMRQPLHVANADGASAANQLLCARCRDECRNVHARAAERHAHAASAPLRAQAAPQRRCGCGAPLRSRPNAAGSWRRTKPTRARRRTPRWTRATASRRSAARPTRRSPDVLTVSRMRAGGSSAFGFGLSVDPEMACPVDWREFLHVRQSVDDDGTARRSRGHIRR